ncbi:hypothetical protein Patl1_33869 [Pistacia atlantica]|uniref:Uncharacterized protein n=1 Tax=Pistacia atlantica TaxID=434234 RepID=A0ACC0ZTF6_9ROSI|nr:hypothetical protein Patl1_33869 [Pistacia atlantica]
MMISIIAAVMFMAMLIVCSFHLYKRWFGQSLSGGDNHGRSQSHVEIDCTVCLNKVLKGLMSPCSQAAPKLDGLVSWLLSSLTSVSNWMEVSFTDEIKMAFCADFGCLS